MIRVGDQGPDVQLIQYVLEVMGYNPGNVNGIFDENTEKAVKDFEKDRGLIVDGVVGPETYSNILPYFFGYTEHYIQRQDTLESLANQYNTTIEAIETANPNIALPDDSLVGTKINIPFNYDVVKTNVPYTYQVLYYDINGLKARYPFIIVDTIGESANGNNIFRIRLGNGSNKVTYNGAHHANEWITTPVLMKWVEQFLKAYVKNTTIRGYNIKEIWESSTIDIIPMVNPDGVNLVINGPEIMGSRAELLIKWNYGSKDFKDWKANINGVDLNRNYNAGWKEYKELEKDIGITGPAPALYSGENPETEPEVKTMVQFTKSTDYRLVLAYHTQGQVIYWSFKDMEPPESRRIGEEFARVSGYSLATPSLIQSYGGYKDWFIQDFRKPGYTIECGKGRNPLPLSQFNSIYNNNEELLLLASII